MRVGIVYQGIFPPRKGASGADRRMRDIARGLAANGNEVHVFVPLRDEAEHTLMLDGLTVHYLGGGRGMLFGRIQFWTHLLRLATTTCQIDWLLLYSVTIDGLAPAWLLKRRGIKIAAEFCDLRSVGSNKTALSQRIKIFLYRLDEMLIPRVTDLNVVISRHLQEHVQKHAPNTATLRLPILVDTETFQSTPAQHPQASRWGGPENVVLAYVGSLWKQEGVRYLVWAFAKVVEKYPQARLVIAGRLNKGPDLDDIEGMVAELGIGDKVHLPGWVSTDDVISIYSRADMLVLPQLNDLFGQAALPTKLAEYSMMGKAIIATAVGDVPFYFEDGKSALLVEDANVDALASAIERLVETPELRQTLGRAAKQVASQQFDYRRAGGRVSDKMHAFNGRAVLAEA